MYSSSKNHFIYNVILTKSKLSPVFLYIIYMSNIYVIIYVDTHTYTHTQNTYTIQIVLMLYMCMFVRG